MAGRDDKGISQKNSCSGESPIYHNLMDSRGRIWLVVDPCGLFGAAMVYVLMLAASVGYLHITQLETALSVFSWIILNALLMMAGWAHVKTMLTDPGAIPPLPREMPVEVIDRRQPRLRNGEYVTSCQRCNCYRPQGAHHCSICQRCVLNME
eukprot:TRINITY_DN10510_c0_g1_i4.p2 TRINITY_DN10510_c0_g1~~TRINITY_DN10510_c0_g1_i4.p2  ORF type:complete len:152 (+),score=10.58 TRINITY_DN10510_c0_g1_i4:27-482(+)